MFDEKSNSLHANAYPLVCFALLKSKILMCFKFWKAILQTLATLYIADLVGFTGFS